MHWVLHTLVVNALVAMTTVNKDVTDVLCSPCSCSFQSQQSGITQDTPNNYIHNTLGPLNFLSSPMISVYRLDSDRSATDYKTCAL